MARAAYFGRLALLPALLAGLAGLACPAWAVSQSEAKDVAIGANCAPGKIEILRQVPGRTGETVFKVNCTDGKGQFIVVQCRVRQCVLIR